MNDVVSYLTVPQVRGLLLGLWRPYMADPEGSPRPPAVHLLGAPGIGKTATVRAVAEELGARLITVDLLSSYPSDLGGVQVPVEKADGTVEVAMARPWAMPTEGPAVVFFDDFNLSSSVLKAAALRWLWGDVVSGHTLPPGVVVVLASNRASDRSGAQEASPIVWNRLLTVGVEADVVSVLEQLDRVTDDPAFKAFVLGMPETALTAEVPATPGPFSTPRSLCLAARTLARLGKRVDGLSTDVVGSAVLVGTIGRRAADQLVAVAELWSALPTLEEVLADPCTARLPEARGVLGELVACVVGGHKIAAEVPPSELGKALVWFGRLPAETLFHVVVTLVCTRRLGDHPAILGWIEKDDRVAEIVASLRWV